MANMETPTIEKILTMLLIFSFCTDENLMYFFACKKTFYNIINWYLKRGYIKEVYIPNKVIAQRLFTLTKEAFKCKYLIDSASKYKYLDVQKEIKWSQLDHHTRLINCFLHLSENDLISNIRVDREIMDVFHRPDLDFKLNKSGSSFIVGLELELSRKENIRAQNILRLYDQSQYAAVFWVIDDHLFKGITRQIFAKNWLVKHLCVSYSSFIRGDPFISKTGEKISLHKGGQNE
jgi:hypothetical protein